MAAGLRAILRSGVVTFIVLGAGAVFLILGIAGVSLRANCLEAGVCVDTAVDPVVTGSLEPATAVEAASAEFTTTAPPSREARLKSAGGLIAGTFDKLQLEADAEMVVASTDPQPTLAKRVVQSVRVTPEGQPIWANPAADAVAAVADTPDAGFVARRQEPVPEIEPLAFAAATPDGAPVPQARPASLDVAAVEPAAVEAEEPAPAAVEVAETAPAAASGEKRIVAGQGVNVRSGPSSSQGKLFALKGGAEVTVSDKQRGWLKVTDEDGRTGWVYQNYLKPAG